MNIYEKYKSEGLPFFFATVKIAKNLRFFLVKWWYYYYRTSYILTLSSRGGGKFWDKHTNRLLNVQEDEKHHSICCFFRVCFKHSIYARVGWMDSLTVSAFRLHYHAKVVSKSILDTLPLICFIWRFTPVPYKIKNHMQSSLYPCETTTLLCPPCHLPIMRIKLSREE
jgi:hypothetical protein